MNRIIEPLMVTLVDVVCDLLLCGGCACTRDMACSVAGITSDANVLTNQLRLFSQRHLLHYGEPIPCEQLVASLCDVKQAYTQFGGVCFAVTYESRLLLSHSIFKIVQL